jgi:ABC-type transport system involved in multi-copper enzyme maturation permease subunit
MGMKRDWLLRYLEVRPLFRILFPIHLVVAYIYGNLGAYGAVDLMRGALPVYALAAIFFAVGAISGDRAAKRFDFSLALPYSRRSYFWSKFWHRYLWLLGLIFGPVAFTLFVDLFRHEFVSETALASVFLLTALWTTAFYVLTYALSVLSAYPLQELVRMLLYCGPVYMAAPFFAPHLFAAVAPNATERMVDPDRSWGWGMFLILLALGALTAALFFFAHRRFMKADIVG